MRKVRESSAMRAAESAADSAAGDSPTDGSELGLVAVGAPEERRARPGGLGRDAGDVLGECVVVGPGGERLAGEHERPLGRRVGVGRRARRRTRRTSASCAAASSASRRSASENG